MIAKDARNTQNRVKQYGEQVRKLQNNRYLTAKKGRRRFHALSDKLYRKDILEEAWKRAKANKGAGGLDEISIQDIVRSGEEAFLEEIEKELKEETYRPQAVKRVQIPKPDWQSCGEETKGLTFLECTTTDTWRAEGERSITGRCSTPVRRQ